LSISDSKSLGAERLTSPAEAQSMFANCFGDVLGHFCLNAVNPISPLHALSGRQIGEVDISIKRAQLAGGNLQVNSNVIFAYCRARGGAVLNGYVEPKPRQGMLRIVLNGAINFPEAIRLIELHIVQG